MKIKIVLTSFFALVVTSAFSQSVSSSPYSMYGLGSLYTADYGFNGAIGSSGIALPSNTSLNNLNPASLGFMYTNHFLLDVGANGIFTTYQDSSTKETRNNIQFSHVGFAMPLSKKSGISVGVLPYSSATYKIYNLPIDIVNSTEQYTLNASATGGLNEFNVSYGYRLGKSFSIGLTGYYLFGNIEDEKDFTIENSITQISKTSYYKGARAALGAQIKIDSTLTLGTNVKSPGQISANNVQSIVTYNGDTSTSSTIETDVSYDVDDYYLPLEVGVGLSKVFKNNINVTLDYTKSFWQGTDQSDIYGDYVNQEKYAFGVSYSKNKSVRSYFDRLKYGAGINYDSGFLEIDSKRVNSLSASIGVNLPIENRTFSSINVVYSYGQRARISTDLIKENFHKISVNLSLDGIWFVKRKID